MEVYWGMGTRAVLFGMIWIATMKSKKIVVVEVELIVGMMIKLKLEKMGYSVTGFTSNGKNAISMVDAIHPDLILMDIRLRVGWMASKLL